MSQAFAQDLRLRFPLLADSRPHGATARAYGVYRRRDAMSARALFVIDGDGVICWSYLAHYEVNPGIDGMLTALEALTYARRGGVEVNRLDAIGRRRRSEWPDRQR